MYRLCRSRPARCKFMKTVGSPVIITDNNDKVLIVKLISTDREMTGDKQGALVLRGGKADNRELEGNG